MNHIIIPQPKLLEKKRESIKKEGADKIHILSDFDKTLTSFFINGEKVHSLISVLRRGDYLTPDYPEKAQALFRQYHPIEIDPEISKEEKKAKMKEWWSNHFQLLIKSGLKKDDIEKVISSKKIKLRDRISQFINYLKEKGIPLVILSSSGLGKEAIKRYLKKEGQYQDNIYIISNTYIWDKKGKAIGVKEPIIHTLNKEAVMAKDFPFFTEIKERKNVILLGDSPSDIDMITGFSYDNLIKIGFLNEEEASQMAVFKKSYDIILTGDPSLKYINDLLKALID